MVNRLATCDNTESEIKDVINALKGGKEYTYWGHNLGYETDYLFVHTKGESRIRGRLKVRQVIDKEELTDEEFAAHIPKKWINKVTKNSFKKYYLVEEAKIVEIPVSELRNKNGNKIRRGGMRDMVIVNQHLLK